MHYVSSLVFEAKQVAQAKVHKMTYGALRSVYLLRSQMAQSVMKAVMARYQSLKSNGHDWTKVMFKKLEYDLVWNRDYSLAQGLFSINTLRGRVKVPLRISVQTTNICKQLQQVGTASARRKLKRIGGRENRWMPDINHQVSNVDLK